MAITLTNPQRNALRRAIADAAIAAGMSQAEIKSFRATLNIAGKDLLLATAEKYGLDVPAIIAGADNTAPAPIQAPMTTIAPIAQPSPSLVQADLDALDAAWRAMDMAAHRSLIVDLATRANRPDTIVEVTRDASGVTQRPQANRTGTRTASDVFGIAGIAGAVDLPVYDAPDAPAIDRHYVLPPQMPAIISQLFKRQRAVWFAGPAGTGKTTLAEQIAARLGRPFVRISCTATTEPETLKGMTVPHPEHGARWQDGQLSAAIKRTGAVILIDEPSVCRDGTLAVFHSVLDSARALCLDEAGGEVIRVAPDVVFILADNTAGQGDVSGQYAGTRMVSNAIRSRIGATVQFEYLAPDKEARLISKKTGAPIALTQILVAYATVTRAKTDSGELPAPVDFRSLLSWAEMIIDGTAPHEAAHLAFVNKASPDAQEILRQLLTTHVAASAVATAIA